MAARRRRTNGNGNGNGGWNKGTVINVLAIVVSLVTASAASFGAAYYLTPYKVSEHDKAINETIPKQFQQETDAIKDEAKAREETRSEFLTKLDTLNQSIGTLTTHAAVQDERSKQINDTLEKISRQLEGVSIHGK